MLKKITNKLNAAVIRAENALSSAVQNRRGEGYVDSGVKILIAVVVGALLLSLLYTLMKTTVMATVSSKVTELFSFTGSST